MFFFLFLLIAPLKASFVSLAPHALLLDLASGKTLYEKNAHERMYPSSMTKILTAYLILEALAQGDIKRTDQVSVSPHASKQGGTRMFLKADQNVTIEDLLKGIIVVSANDACTAMAEFMSGSEAVFAEMMNEKAKELGTTNSHFTNASGLPSPQHFSTCWDLAIIAKKTLENFPQDYKTYYRMTQFAFNGIQQTNRNTLLKNNFADGIKTGKTDIGKCGIVASAQRGNRRLLLVLNGLESEMERTQEAKKILNWGFHSFQNITFFKKGEKVKDITVWKNRSVSLVTKDDITLSIPRNLLRKAEVKIIYYAPLHAPLLKNQTIGSLQIAIPSQKDLNFPLVAQEEVKEIGLWSFVKSPFQFLFSLFKKSAKE